MDELWIPALADKDGRIIEETFEEKQLNGPAVVMLEECWVERTRPFGVTMREGGSLEELLWVIPEDRQHIAGVIMFIRCTFIGCRFHNVGFAAKWDELDKLRGMFRPESA